MPEKLVYRTCLDNHAESVGPVNKQKGPWRRGTDWAAGWVLGGVQPSSPEVHGRGRGCRGRKGIQSVHQVRAQTPESDGTGFESWHCHLASL